MPKPITDEQEKFMNDLYYEKKIMMGRDRTFAYVQDNHPEQKLSRRQIAEWISAQETNQINTRAKSVRDIKSTVYKTRGSLGVDLKDMQNFAINGYSYMFNAVDLFTRKAYSVPMKQKTDKEALSAFKKIVSQVGKVRSVRSDRGSEFVSTIFKQYLNEKNIKQVLSAAGTPSSNGMIERLNGTLGRIVSKALLSDPEFNWVENTDKILNAYNTTPNKTTSKTPNELDAAAVMQVDTPSDKSKRNLPDDFSKRKKEGKDLVDDVHQQETNTKSKQHKLSTQEFEVGDKVRLYVFEENQKFKQRNWSKEIYTVAKVFKPKADYSVYEYKLEGLDNRYKSHEILKIKRVDNPVKHDTDDVFRISKIVALATRKGERFFHIKWKGFKAKDDTLEPYETIVADAPKMAKLFMKNSPKEFVKKQGKWIVVKKRAS